MQSDESSSMPSVIPLQMIYLTIDECEFAEDEPAPSRFECKISTQGLPSVVINSSSPSVEIPVFSLQEQLTLVFFDSTSQSPLFFGSVSFSFELLAQHSVLKRWITLFDPEDDKYDGDFYSDDVEFPRVLLSFQMSPLEHSQQDSQDYSLKNQSHEGQTDDKWEQHQQQQQQIFPNTLVPSVHQWQNPESQWITQNLSTSAIRGVEIALTNPDFLQAQQKQMFLLSQQQEQYQLQQLQKAQLERLNNQELQQQQHLLQMQQGQPWTEESLQHFEDQGNIQGEQQFNRSGQMNRFSQPQQQQQQQVFHSSFQMRTHLNDSSHIQTNQETQQIQENGRIPTNQDQHIYIADRNQMQLVLASDSENPLSSPPEELNSMCTEDETLRTSEESQTRQLTETESHQEQSYRNFEITNAQRRFEEVAALEKEIFSLKAVLATRETNLRVADHKVQHSEAREAQLKSQLQMLGLLVDDLKSRNQCLENDFTRVSNQLLTRKNKENSQTYEERIQFDEEVKDLQGQIELRMERESELEERIRELEMKVDEKEKIIERFEKEKEEKGEKGIREIAEELRSKLAGKTEEYMGVVEELNNLKQQADAFKESSSKTVEYLNQVLGQKQLEIESLHVQVDSAPQQLPHLLQKLQEASLREVALQEQLNLLKQQKKCLEESQIQLDSQEDNEENKDNQEQIINETVKQRVELIVSERLLAIESERIAEKQKEQGRIQSFMEETRREIEKEVRQCVEQENKIIQENIEQEVEALRNDRLILKEEQMQLDQEKNKLESDRLTAQKDKCQFNEEKQEFDSQKQLVQDEKQELNEQKRTLEEDIIQLEQKIKKVQEESNQIEAAKEQLLEEKKKVNEMNQQIERDQNNIQNDKNLIKTEFIKIKEQQQNIQCLFEELETQMGVIEQQKQEIAAGKQELVDERNILIDEKNRLNVLEKLIQEEQMQLQGKETQIIEEIKQVSTERDQMKEQQLAECQIQLNKKDEEILHLKDSLVELKDSLMSENQQIIEERKVLANRVNQYELTINENLMKIKEITEQLMISEKQKEEYERRQNEEQAAREEQLQKKQLEGYELEQKMNLEFEIKYQKLTEEVNCLQKKLFECEKQLTQERLEVQKKDGMLLENMSQIDMLNEQLILNEMQRQDTRNSQKELESSQTLNKVLESQIQVLNDALSLCQARLHDIQSQFNIHTNKTAHEISNSNKVIEDIQKQLKQKEQEIEQYVEGRIQFEKECHLKEGEYMEKITYLTEEIEVLKGNKEKLIQELSELEKKFLEISEELILKVQELNEKSQEKNQIQEELNRKEAEMKESVERMVERNRDYDEKMEELKIIAKRESEETLRKYEEFLIREEELKKLIELKNDVIIQIEQHNAVLENQIQVKDEQIQLLQVEQQPKEDQSSKITELVDRIEQAEKQLNLKEQEYNELQKLHKEHEEQVLNLQTEINSWKETVQMLEEKTNALVQELEESEDKNDSKNERIKNLEDDMAVLIDEIRNYKENMIGQEVFQERERKIECLKLEIAQLETQFCEQKEQMTIEFEDELRLLKKEVSILREQLVQQSNMNKDGIKQIMENNLKDRESYEQEKVALLDEIQAIKEEKLMFQQRSSELFEKNKELLDRIDNLSERHTDLVYINESLKDKMILILKEKQEQELKNGQKDIANTPQTVEKQQYNTQQTQTEDAIVDVGLFEQLKQDLSVNQVHLQELDRFNGSLLEAKKQLEEQVEVLIKQNDELSNVNSQLEYQCLEFINQHKNISEKVIPNEREPLQEADSNLIQSEIYQQNKNIDKEYSQSLHFSQGFNHNQDDSKGSQENQLHYSDNSSLNLAATQNYSHQSNRAFSSRTSLKQNIPPHPQSLVFSNTLKESITSMKGEKINGSQFPYFLLPPKKHERSLSSSSKNSLIQLKVIASRESPFKI